jgi:hypothetical protein
MLRAENTINCMLPLLQVPIPFLVSVSLRSKNSLTRIWNHLPVQPEGMTFDERNDESNDKCNSQSSPVNSHYVSGLESLQNSL